MESQRMGFNGAPDWYLGKGGVGVKSLPRRGFEEGLRAMVVLGWRLAPRERTVHW